jgi:hypothetical protein
LIILLKLGIVYKIWSSTLCSFVQPPVTSSILGPNILLNTLFSNTLSFPNIWTVPHFQNICYLFLCHDLALHFGDETATYTLFSFCLLLDQSPY